MAGGRGVGVLVGAFVAVAVAFCFVFATVGVDVARGGRVAFTTGAGVASTRSPST